MGRAQIAPMTGDERNALLLAARLLESGVAVQDPALGERGGHVDVALTLTGALRRVGGGPETARGIVASLRSAAREQAEA